MDDPVVLEDEAAAGVPPEEDVAAVMAPEEDATANRSMTKKQNRFKDPEGVSYLQASEKLKHIMQAKKLLEKNISSIRTSDVVTM